LFYDNEDCKGCPISKHTGQELCKGSPYHDVYEAYVLDMRKHSEESKVQFMDACYKMYMWLKDLHEYYQNES